MWKKCTMLTITRERHHWKSVNDKNTKLLGLKQMPSPERLPPSLGFCWNNCILCKRGKPNKASFSEIPSSNNWTEQWSNVTDLRWLIQMHKQLEKEKRNLSASGVNLQKCLFTLFLSRQSALRHSVHTNLICALAGLLLWKTKYYFMFVFSPFT